MNIKLSLLKLAAYYGTALSDQQLQIYSEQLAEYLSDDQVKRAVKLYIDQPLNEFFPRPVSKLIALINKPVTNQDQAQNIINLIKKAVIDHQSSWVDGYFNGYDKNREPIWFFENDKKETFKTWRDAARSEVGELGLIVIDRLGGWKTICERFDQEPEGVVIGQFVKNIEATINIAEAGVLDRKPELPDLKSSPVLKLVNIKSLEGVS